MLVLSLCGACSGGSMMCGSVGFSVGGWSDDFVEHMPALVWSIWPSLLIADGLMNLLTRLEVSPLHPRK